MRFISVSLLSMLIAMASFTTTTSKLTVTSSAFSNGEMIPKKYSCQGLQINPPIQITNVPQNAKSVALIVHDPDAPVKGGFTHWVVWNIDPSYTIDIPEHFKGASQGVNGEKKPGYTGMCPPSGTHHYHFYAYALDIKLELDNTTDKSWLQSAMQGHIIAQGELTGLYKKD